MKKKCEICGESKDIKAGTSPQWCADCFEDYIWQKLQKKVFDKKGKDIHLDLIS